MKLTKVYICSNCGQQYPKWQGQCSNCGMWNTLVEDVIETGKSKKSKKSLTDFSSRPLKINEIKISDEYRIPTGISELDKVLSGGIVKGQILLLGGMPGIGKSTLMLEVARALNSKKLKTLYISGEESPQQIAQRADRLKIKGDYIYILCETNLSEIIKYINDIKPDTIIIDSIQTLYHPEFPSSSGSVIQIRETTSELIKIAKSKNITIFILGHITKQGDFAGPKLLEHMVDTVLYFESDRDSFSRVLRSYKNRFGNIDEIGIFEMTENGLVPLDDYSKNIIDEQIIPGKTYSCVYEGTRAFIIRVESLVNRTMFPYPKRVFSQIDTNYAQILIAAIEKNTDIRFDNYDIYVNIRSNFKTKDRTLDMAFCSSIISSVKDTGIDNTSAFLGEISILGQIYSTGNITKKIKELEKHGFKKIYIPANTREKITPLNSSTQIFRVENLKHLYTLLLK